MKPSRLLKRFGAFFDPFLVLGIFVLFLIPIITIENLSPSFIKQGHQPDVLGVTSNKAFVIDPNLAYENGITVAEFQQTTDSSYSFQVQLSAHTAGSFQNMMFSAQNTSEVEKKINITPNFESIAEGTEISVVVDSVKFVILDTDGTIYPPTIYVLPGDSLNAYVRIESETAVNYAGGFSIDLSVE
jgi:hypothetical protein